MNSGDKTCDALAAIRLPLPESNGPDDQGWEEAVQATYEDREHFATNLQLAWDDGGFDPVLGEIEDARRQMLAAEHRLHLLVAFAREFVTPRPYPLEQIAEAAGMSISGVRTCYDDDDVALVAATTGHRRRDAASTPAARRRSQREISAGDR